MKKLALTTLLAASILLSSCNTFIGMGRDMRILGEGMEKTSNKVRGQDSDSGSTSVAINQPRRGCSSWFFNPCSFLWD
jgi:predicted small secreted protein